MIFSVAHLMQTEHPAYLHFRSPRPIPDTQLPAFFDLCSNALTEFMGILQIASSSELKESEMFVVMNEMTDTFRELMENDEPDEFFHIKEHFESTILPSFRHLMEHLARCVDKPEPLKMFYSRLAKKTEQAYEYHILGVE